jgi:pimeloyl-ACP methyl ester carboxylesterase
MNDNAPANHSSQTGTSLKGREAPGSGTRRVFTAASKDGAAIGCVVEGKGPPLLVVHGTGDTQRGWRRLAPLLAPHFTLYLMDRRGRGVSGDRDAYALEREWEDVAAVIDAIAEESRSSSGNENTGRVNVFAHSFGGMCALEGARMTSRIGRMVIYEPSVNRNIGNPKREFAIEEMARLIALGDRDGVVSIHLRNIINVSEDTLEKQRAQTDAWAGRLAMAHTMPRELQALKHYQFDASRFAKLGVPVTFLLGEKTVGHGPATAQSLVDAVPGARLVKLAGQGHFAMLTAPELLANVIIEALK